MKLESKVKLFKVYFVLAMIAWQAGLVIAVFYLTLLVITLDPNPVNWPFSGEKWRVIAVSGVGLLMGWWWLNWHELADFLSRKEDHIRDHLERRSQQ